MRYALITDHVVESLHGRKMSLDLQSKGYDVQLFSFPAGETSKTRATKEQIEDRLLSAGYSRNTTIIALGGGVVSDLAGFLASTFCRGVPLVLIPTTLLAMVDASIGGKTGVNTCHGKNMIGTFYPPTKTIIDLGFLSTLTDKEWFNGKVEMLKAALIADADFFHNFSAIPLGTAIARAREIKSKIVDADSNEKGLRRVLNLGHTLGHAFETLSHYQISHGEAVSAGIVLEARIAQELGILDKSTCALIAKQLPRFQIGFDAKDVIDVLRLDKKMGRFILLQDIGVAIEREVPDKIIEKVLNGATLRSC